MINKIQMVFFTAMIATGLTAVAQQVYENVDEQGEVEFSDRSSPGAKTIEVKPNVIDVTPVKPIESSTPVSSAEAPATPGGMAPDVEHQGVATDDERLRRREVRKESAEHIEHQEGAVHAPAHRGGHRR